MKYLILLLILSGCATATHRYLYQEGDVIAFTRGQYKNCTADILKYNGQYKGGDDYIVTLRCRIFNTQFFIEQYPLRLPPEDNS